MGKKISHAIVFLSTPSTGGPGSAPDHVHSLSLSLHTDNYIEVVTSPDPSQCGAQLSILFSCPVEKVSKAIQAKGAAVSTCTSGGYRK